MSIPSLIFGEEVPLAYAKHNATFNLHYEIIFFLEFNQST